VNVWLDDVRPTPPGWVLVQTVPAAKALLETGEVQQLSLDHDLGLCDQCWAEARAQAEAAEAEGRVFKLNLDFANKMAWNHGLASYASCIHNGTGYDLVCWMEETGTWPAEKPTVHSANPVGAARMRQVIEKEWRKRG
jgi:phage I-like protein